jgi:hypothetical protein
VGKDLEEKIALVEELQLQTLKQNNETSKLLV